MQTSTVRSSFALFIVCAALAQTADVRHALAKPLFKDVTAASGLAGNVTCAGASWRDFDADGRPDVLIGGHVQRPHLFKNLGNGKFKDVTTANMERPTNLSTCGGFVGAWGDQHGRAWADFDNDGDQDLVQMIGAQKGLGCGPKQLYVNNNGHLVDRAVEYSIDYPDGRGRVPTWFDFDNDGLLDLFMGGLARADGKAPPTLFRQNANGFSDVRNVTGFKPTSDWGAQVSDITGDERLDILHRGALAQALPAKPGAVSSPYKIIDASTSPFTDVTPIKIEASREHDLAIADYDGDLRPDIFVANQWTAGSSPKGHRLYLNRHDGFVNATGKSNVNAILRSAFYSAVAADFDNDTDINIFIDAGNPTQGDLTNVILWNNGDGTFVPEDGAAGAVGTLTGTPDMVTIADYDVDGNQDILLTYRVAGGKSTVQLYHNEGPHNHWLEVDLHGRTSNADAVGAKVFVTAGGHTQLREQNGGVHFKWGQNDQRLHFGLGPNQTVNKLVVEWPRGAETVRQNIPADHVLKLTEPG